METTLHRQLKELYGGEPTDQEVWLDDFRIDVIDAHSRRLVEIQASPLSAIRDKVRRLLTAGHDVLVVKPLAARKHLINRSRAGGEIESSRLSPLRQTPYHLFDELVNFVTVFPHPRLTIEVLLTEQEEHRLPATRWRRWRKKYRVEDRVLRSVISRTVLRRATDLRKMLPDGLDLVFSTEEIARLAEIPRGLAQRMAYCLRKTEAVSICGKRGNAILYGIPKRRKKAA